MASFLLTMKHNKDGFIDKIIDPSVLKELIKQYPGAAFKQMCSVAPLCTFYSQRNPQAKGIINPNININMGPPPASKDAPALSTTSNNNTAPSYNSIMFGSAASVCSPLPTFGFLFGESRNC
jgi:hypothetical protein